MSDRKSTREKEEKIQQVKEMLKEDPESTDEQLAKKLKRSISTIRRYRKIIIDREKGIGEEERENIQKLQKLQKKKPDITKKELANELQCSEDKVDEYIRIIEENDEFKSKKERTMKKIKELLEDNPKLTDQEIADIIHRSKDLVSEYRRILEERGEIEAIDEIEELRELMDKQPKLTNQQLADKFECSVSTIVRNKKIIREQDSKLKVIKDIKIERMQEIKELRTDNPDISVQELADRYQCDVTTIRKYIKELEEKGELKSEEEIKIEKLQKQLEKNPKLTDKQLADILECDKRTIVKYKKKIEERDIQKLKREKPKITAEEIAKELKIDIDKVKEYIKRIEERDIQRIKKVKEKEPKITAEEIAKKLKIDIDKVNEYIKIIEERYIQKIQEIKEIEPKITAEEIAKELQISKNEVKKYIEILKERNIQKVKELKREDPKISIKEMAKRLNCTESKIDSYIRILKERGEWGEIVKQQIKELVDNFEGQKSIIKDFKIYISYCKKREGELQREELPSIKEVALLIDSYDAIVFYLNVCIKFKEIEEAIFFANGQTYNETFTKEQQNKIRELVASMKEMRRKEEARSILRTRAKVGKVANTTDLSKDQSTSPIETATSR